jgi:hypothetical protein
MLILLAFVIFSLRLETKLLKHRDSEGLGELHGQHEIRN